eukprot:gene3024-3295_t
MLPSDWAGLVDDKRLNLLEERLMGRSPKKPAGAATSAAAAVLPSSPLSSMDMMQSPVKAMDTDPPNTTNNISKLVKDGSSVSTLLDMQPSNSSAHTQPTLPPQLETQVVIQLDPVPDKEVNKEVADPEVIVVVDETNSQHSRSNHEIRKAATNAFDLLSGAKRLRMEEDSHSQLTHDSMEGSVDRPLARLKQDDGDNNSPYQQHGGDNGSRGANSVPKRTIVSYFTSHTEGNALPANSIFSSATAATDSAVNTGNTSNTTTAPSNPSTSTTSATKSSGSGGSSSKGNKANSSSASGNNSQLSATINDLKKQLELIKHAKEQAENKTLRLEVEMKEQQAKSKTIEEKSSRISKALEDVHRKMAMQEFRRKRDRMALDCVRLGKITYHRTTATVMSEVWEDGYAWKELNKRAAELLERKEELESRKRKVTTMKRQAKKVSTTEDVEGELDADLDLATETEAVRYHFDQLKKDEIALAEERRLLDSEKAIHQKELRRCQCEERSRFYRDLPCLNDRYLLQHMLGRGGFSEVWKALDLVELREVAVKIHQLNPQWSEERKQSYIRHVTREYNIHKDMKHPRVVQLFDVFEIDVNSFATVLEYCKGIDLDEKLKRQRIIAEKDARVIFMQIMSGLRYLNKPYSTSDENNSNRKISIIHFDLKPVIDEANEGTSMELTSQGAGTYWYLPPECFAKGPDPPRISSKVDVWSAGIIFYQMLYGSRPFGEGKSQEHVWTENIIYNASQVEFPSDPKAPKVSEEAKDLIRACLTRDQRLRPDVMAVCQHPYLKNK